MYAAQVTDGTVTQVIVGTADWANDRLDGTWVDTVTLVGIGWEQWDGGLRPPAPYPSWTWDDGWHPPVPQPTDGEWTWDEDSQAWVEVTDGWAYTDGTFTPPPAPDPDDDELPE